MVVKVHRGVRTTINRKLYGLYWKCRLYERKIGASILAGVIELTLAGVIEKTRGFCRLEIRNYSSKLQTKYLNHSFNNKL